MPRKARLSVPGAVHHLMSRGIEGNAIFRNDTQRRFFVSLLEKNVARSGYLVYAWALMDNHYHLVIRMSDYPLGVFMRNLNGPYAQYFRKADHSRGYLFQDRYKSIVTQDQNYIEELIRYVHLNPLRAGTCADMASLDHYPWCGHATLMGNRACAFQSTADVLKRFASSKRAAIRLYRTFLADGVELESELVTAVRKANKHTEDIHQSGCWVIGNRQFVRRALEQDRRRRLRVARHAREAVSVADIASQVARHKGIAESDILRRGREDTRSSARRAVACIARERYGMPIGEIARFFGISSPSVSAMIRRGEGEVEGGTIPNISSGPL